MKTAFITGITGQDGSYLAEFLLAKGYQVHGLQRYASLPNTGRLDNIALDRHAHDARLCIHYGDLSDSANLARLIGLIQPDEVYNLAAMSHVAVSFEAPEYAANVDGLGTLRLLEAIRLQRLEKRTRFYQASTSELFGQVREIPQRECTPFHPRSPYAVAKLYAYWITVNYREAYGMYACNGILFNHESPRRGEHFVTRKITQALCTISQGRTAPLLLGNMDALRDWGHARDYVEMQWLMLQQDRPDDFVIATGHQYSVRRFVELAAAELGIAIEWRGNGIDEQGVIAAIRGDKVRGARVGQVIVAVDEQYFRPTEVETLLGDPTKARELLGWVPTTSFETMVREMVAHDLAIARRNRAMQASFDDAALVWE